jgi:hypothetical protein
MKQSGPDLPFSVILQSTQEMITKVSFWSKSLGFSVLLQQSLENEEF